MLRSGAVGEAMEEGLPLRSSYTGVQPRFVSVSGGRRTYRVFVSRMQSRMADLWMAGGWTKFDLSSAAAVVDDELRSTVKELGVRPQSTGYR